MMIILSPPDRSQGEVWLHPTVIGQYTLYDFCKVLSSFVQKMRNFKMKNSKYEALNTKRNFNVPNHKFQTGLEN